MGKRTDDRSVIDVVPNGVAFNLAKSWLGLVKKKKDDEDDGNADRSENENVTQQQQQRDVLVRGIPSGRAKRGRGNVGRPDATEGKEEDRNARTQDSD